MKFLLLSVISILFFIGPLSAQSVVGKWKTIDDETNKPKSIVEVYMQDGKVYGKILKLFREPNEDQDPICDKCEGALHNKKIIGMQIINGLEKDGDEWEGDDGILDPAKGTLYDCKIWVDEDDSSILNVRGYIGFFFRTQTWHRVK